MKGTKRQRGGFTLIEIVIVLAIAAALILLVFLAVSGTQKTKRDHIRKNEAGQLMSAMEQWLNNNGGSFTSFPVTGLPASYTNNITDPLTGAAPVYTSVNIAGPGIDYAVRVTCGLVVPGTMRVGTQTSYAVEYWSEVVGGPVCIDNVTGLVSS